jgi:hypothetical protein
MTADRHLVYLIGAPGSGKSTLMAKLTKGIVRLPYSPPETLVAHDRLVDPKTGVVIGAEIGKRRDLFSGTDALPSSVIEKAIPWINGLPYALLLAEGARLANIRFMRAAMNADYLVTLALLDHPDAEAWRKVRARAVGREQSPSWVKGRLSASRNLADQLNGVSGFTVLRGHPDELEAELTRPIAAALLSMNA